MEALQPSFLGAITEVCIVTADHKKTMDGLLRLGIGPFQVFDFTPSTLPERYFRGKTGSFELKVCFAKHANLTFEIMQPTGGESLMAEYLDQVRTPTVGAWPLRRELTGVKRRGQEGIQHIAFDCKNIPMSERKRQMRERGFEPAMEGVWKGRKGTCHFCFFDTEAGTGTVFESIDFSDDWEDPDFEWYPHAPAGGVA
ncbi:MAG: hypothetical protein HETSPECPRED_002089 [Heterodermia speciosa]|uniref:VOC domain-containing protein n=1 Tax=Heterodermia speciosa TaxID=116794 RepID=A0A8H3J386_9LECA|nr:MAG: hypothetical protein HETSPECPRED_002089 [Heterodermia speciosa]